MKSHSFSERQLFVFSSNVFCCGGNILTCLGLSLNSVCQKLAVILNRAGVREITCCRLLFVLQEGDVNQLVTQSGKRQKGSIQVNHFDLQASHMRLD